MKLKYPKKDFLSYTESKLRFDNADSSHDPFCCVSAKMTGIVKLLIGYTLTGEGVFISDTKISLVKEATEIEAFKCSYTETEVIYKKVKRPDGLNSIFKKPEVGDTIMCVANGRYVGCEFGETYTVDEVSGNGRISVDRYNQYTYESKYFIVIDSKRIKAEKADTLSNRTITGGNSIVIGHTQTGNKSHYMNKDGFPWITGNSIVVSGNGVNPYTFEVSDGPIQRKSLIDEDIKKRKVFDNERVLKRNVVRTSTAKKRELHDADVVNRKVTN